MNKKIERYTMLICLLFIFTFIKSEAITIKAFSASITLSTKTKEVQKGDTFAVTISLDSNDIMGGFEGYLSYNEELVEFITGGKFISGGDGLLRISDLDSDAQSESKKYGIKFKAKYKGVCTFSMDDMPVIYNADGSELSVSSNQLSVSIINSEKLSNNANLSRLLISPGELNQGFQNDITAYKTTIPFENDMLFISAVPEDPDSVVTLEGNENLKVGKNFVHILVTAPSGISKDIQIEVTRLEEGEILQGIQEPTESEEPESIENKTEIMEVDGITSLISTHQYTLQELSDDSLIPEGYTESTISIDSIEVKAYVSTENAQSEFVLLYLKNNFGEENFYQYDRVEKTIQRYQISNKVGNKLQMDDGITKETDSSLNTAIAVILVLAVLCIILTCAIVAIILKHKNEKNEES